MTTTIVCNLILVASCLHAVTSANVVICGNVRIDEYAREELLDCQGDYCFTFRQNNNVTTQGCVEGVEAIHDIVTNGSDMCTMRHDGIMCLCGDSDHCNDRTLQLDSVPKTNNTQLTCLGKDGRDLQCHNGMCYYQRLVYSSAPGLTGRKLLQGCDPPPQAPFADDMLGIIGATLLSRIDAASLCVSVGTYDGQENVQCACHNQRCNNEELEHRHKELFGKRKLVKCIASKNDGMESGEMRDNAEEHCKSNYCYVQLVQVVNSMGLFTSLDHRRGCLNVSALDPANDLWTEFIHNGHRSIVHYERLLDVWLCNTDGCNSDVEKLKSHLTPREILDNIQFRQTRMQRFYAAALKASPPLAETRMETYFYKNDSHQLSVTIIAYLIISIFSVFY